MILLSSNAQDIFWLGRYLTRTQYLCSQFPFQDQDTALAYAHAFCLPAFDVASLNNLVLDPAQPASFSQQFQCAKNNIYNLRGVLSAFAYAELNQLIRTANKDLSLICGVAAESQDILEAESQDVFLFFSLGQYIDQLDRQIRLKQDIEFTLHQLEKIVELLQNMGWTSLTEAWLQLKAQPDVIGFYQFGDHIQELFEADV